MDSDKFLFKSCNEHLNAIEEILLHKDLSLYERKHIFESLRWLRMDISYLFGRDDNFWDRPLGGFDDGI